MAAFQAYCEYVFDPCFYVSDLVLIAFRMGIDGGGWQMCYTTNDLVYLDIIFLEDQPENNSFLISIAQNLIQIGRSTLQQSSRQSVAFRTALTAIARTVASPHSTEL
jgi:hypothetical protein